jgi:hypothetical protein
VGGWGHGDVADWRVSEDVGFERLAPGGGETRKGEAADIADGSGESKQGLGLLLMPSK